MPASDDPLRTEDQLAAAREVLDAELNEEKDLLEKIFDGKTSDVDAIRKLNNPHFLCNYISPDGEDDDDDFRPY